MKAVILILIVMNVFDQIANLYSTSTVIGLQL